MTLPTLTGAVLAGGESRRMGRDKATLVLDGEPLWQRQVRLLRDTGATTVGIVRRADQPSLTLPSDTPLWLDTIAGIGPLAGLHAALTACATDLLAVVAVDMPALDAAWFRDLQTHGRPGCGVIAQHPDGLFEPLAALYPREALATVTTHATHGPHALQALATVLIQQGQLTIFSLTSTNSPRLASWNKRTQVNGSS
jgi:molybdenum cofactor guanylyltransferase